MFGLRKRLKARPHEGGGHDLLGGEHVRARVFESALEDLAEPLGPLGGAPFREGVDLLGQRVEQLLGTGASVTTTQPNDSEARS